MVIPEGYKLTEVGVIPEDWESVSLLSKCALLNGLTFTPDNVRNHGLLVVRSSNIQDNRLIFDDNVYVDMHVEKEKLLKENDIIICVRNGSTALIGKCAKAERDYPYSFGAFMAVLRGENNDFIFQLLQQGSVQKAIIKNSGATINQITNGDFKKISVPYPRSTAERNSISNALSDIDALNVLFEKLLAKKKAIKQGTMQELLTGKRRLPGFSGEWVTYQISDICRLINGRAYAQNELLPSGKYRILRLGNLFTNEHWYYSDLELPERQYCTKGDLIYAWSASIGPHIWTGEKVIYHYHIWKVELTDMVCKEYMYHYLRADVQKLMNELQGGTMAHLTKEAMEKRVITIPPYDEQVAIAKILSDVDDGISVLEQKLAKNRRLKEGMMQQLLTGKVRLIESI